MIIILAVGPTWSVIASVSCISTLCKAEQRNGFTGIICRLRENTPQLHEKITRKDLQDSQSRGTVKYGPVGLWDLEWLCCRGPTFHSTRPRRMFMETRALHPDNRRGIVLTHWHIEVVNLLRTRIWEVVNSNLGKFCKILQVLLSPSK
jgi:hypothetical protein